MKQGFLVLLLAALVAAVGIAGLRNGPSAPASEPGKNAAAEPRPAAPSPAGTAAPAALATSAPETELDALLARDVRGMRSLTDHPERESARLAAEAAALTPADCEALGARAADPSRHPDSRYAAAYLLARAAPASSIEALARLALSPIPAGSPNQVTFERIVRFLALEGLSEARGSDVAQSTLTSLASGDSPLRLRARLALAAFLGKAPALRAQDEKKLSQLIERGEPTT